MKGRESPFPPAAFHYPRRPRAPPPWQAVHHAWNDFIGGYEKHHRRTMPVRVLAIHGAAGAKANFLQYAGAWERGETRLAAV